MKVNDTYTLGNASASISLNVVENLLDLSLNLGLSPQNLSSLDVQEAEGIDSVESVEELRLREGAVSVILRILECDTGLQKKIIQSAAESKR